MPPLWKPEDWPSRLAELEARTGELKEAPLRRDVRSLGTLLGEVLREQAGDDLYTKVEELRQSAIRRREAQANGDVDEAETLMQKAVFDISGVSVQQAYQLSRAFGFYFELINLAETNHRKRRRLSSQVTGDTHSQRGTLRGTLSAMKAAGISADAALEWLRRIFIVPVFTAHPTEVARRSVMFKRRRIGNLLEQLDQIPISDEELEHLQQQLTAEITALWQTDEVRSRKPTVYDEIQMGLDFYDSSLFATLTPLYQEIADALRCEYELNIEVADLPLLLGFGSWIGGDRDGNPFVTPQITRDAIQLARTHLLGEYRRQIQLVIDLLTPSSQQAPVSEAVRQRLAEYVAALHLPEESIFGAQFEYEYYRRLLACVLARLEKTLSAEKAVSEDSAVLEKLPPYQSASEFLDDLNLVRTQPGRESRPAPGADPARSAAAARPHLRLSPAHARHSPACQAAVGCAPGSNRMEREGRRQWRSACSAQRPIGRCNRDFPHRRRDQGAGYTGDDPLLCHQRRNQCGGCSERRLAGAAGRSSRGRRRRRAPKCRPLYRPRPDAGAAV